VIMQVCASRGLERESIRSRPGLKLRRNQVALASHAAAGIERQLLRRPTDRTRTTGPFRDSANGYPGQSSPAIRAARRAALSGSPRPGRVRAVLPDSRKGHEKRGLQTSSPFLALTAKIRNGALAIGCCWGLR
jgi:hypothetical protein